MLKGVLAVTVFFVLANFAHAGDSSKPINLITLDKVTSDKGHEAEQACLIQKNLSASFDYVVDTVLPRANSEVDELLQVHVVNGKRIHVAFYDTWRDLFHFHIRYSTHFVPTTLSDLQDSKNYHLHYHSFEHPVLMRLFWITQLKYLTDPFGDQWVEPRYKAATAPPAEDHPEGGHYSAPPPDPIKAMKLTEEGIAVMADKWNTALGSESPGLDFVTLWTRNLNDWYPAEAWAELNRYRSVASFDDRYDILPQNQNDLPDIWQPVDISFEMKGGHALIVKELTDYMQRHGAKYLVNYDGDLKNSLVAADEATRADAVATYARIVDLISKQESKDSTLYNTIVDSKSFNTVLTLVGGRLFMLRYNVERFDCTGTPKEI